jgi:gamma-glutamylcyclotransferase (GGCT)/AIG2-like uncharacterized protein YtfP
VTCEPADGFRSGGLFAYGTLQFPPVLDALLGRRPRLTPARADGWRAAPLVARPYPGLVRDPSATAVGVVVSGLTPDEWALLDAFEGEFYRLVLVDVGTGTAEPTGTSTYMWLSADEVLPGTWERDRFRATGLDAFVDRCRRWRAVYGSPGRVAPP